MKTRARKPKQPVRKQVKPIPEGYHAVTPQLTVQGTGPAIDFYKKAFGARELMRMAGPDGKSIVHAELKIGDSVVFLGDESPGAGTRSPGSLGGTTGSLYVYVKDVDATFKRAVAAGAQVKMPLTDMFWGDRYGRVLDPFGHEWGLATHREDVTPREMKKRAEAFFARLAQPT